MRAFMTCFGFLVATLALAGSAVLTPTALGQITFGSKLKDVETLLRETGQPENGYGDESCRYVSFPSFPATLFMVEDGIVTRVDAVANLDNSLGISVGDSMESVLKAHAAAQVTPHHYDPNGFYLTFPSADNKSAIVLEVGDGKVVDIRAGLRPSVEYVEGCL